MILRSAGKSKKNVISHVSSLRRISATPKDERERPFTMFPGVGEPSFRHWVEEICTRVMGNLILSVLSVLVVVGAACGHKKPATIMVITPTGGLEYWERFDRAVKASARASGIEIEVAAPQSVTDYTEQAQMVENAIARHVQGIIVSPAHQLVLASVLQKAVQAHIPVVIVGNPVALSSRDFAAFIGWDEQEAGRLAARRFIAMLSGRGEVGVVGVSPTVEGSSLIEKAFADEIARAPRVKLVAVKYGLSDWARGRQAVLDLIAEHPDVKGIFTTDEFSTHAAAYTFDSHGNKRPLLIGVSDEMNELEGLKAGRTDALVISNPQELGTRAMQAMRVALSGSDSQSFSTQLPVSLVDAKSMGESAVVGILYQQRD
jgi:ribose transport system substrate-binding protein